LKMNELFESWLFIGPHPDDVELGCGGTIAKYLNDDVKMHYVIVSPATEDSKNKNIISELKKSAQILGLNLDNITVLNFPRRVLHDYRADIRYKLIEIVKKIDPDVIFTTSPGDLHQDHSLVGEEVLRLFRDRNIIGYEVISSSLDFVSNLYVELDENALKRKMQALTCYKSQGERYYFDMEVIKSLARMRGAQARTRYAEAFKALRLILR